MWVQHFDAEQSGVVVGILSAGKYIAKHMRGFAAATGVRYSDACE